MFDYILTGPISGVSAGSYIAGLVNDILVRRGAPRRCPTAATAAFIAILITALLLVAQHRGIHESSDDAMTIMKIATVMVVSLIALVRADAGAARRQRCRRCRRAATCSSRTMRSAG